SSLEKKLYSKDVVTTNGLFFVFKAKYLAILKALASFLYATALINSKLLYSLLMPILSSTKSALIKVLFFKIIFSLSISFAILLKSLPKNSTNMATALGSISNFSSDNKVLIQPST